MNEQGEDECWFEDYCNPAIPPPPSPEPTKKPTTAAPTTCEGRKWYLLITNELTEMCSNGYDIPSSAQSSMEYYDTLKECCEEEFNGGKCMFVDVCNPGQPTPSPTILITNEPTFGTTPTVSKETTGPPTMALKPRRGYANY